MEYIREAFLKTDKQLKAALQYSEANYQNAFCYHLSKYGTVQKEVVVSYFFEDEGRRVTYGSGRIDVVFCCKNEEYIIELKISPKHYRMSTYQNQVQRYLEHYDNKKAIGVLCVWSIHGSQLKQIPRGP